MPEDIMRIQSSFTSKIVSRLISKFIQKKLGVKIDLKLHYLDIQKEHVDTLGITFAIKATGKIDGDNLAKLVSRIKED